MPAESIARSLVIKSTSYPISEHKVYWVPGMLQIMSSRDGMNFAGNWGTVTFAHLRVLICSVIGPLCVSRSSGYTRSLPAALLPLQHWACHSDTLSIKNVLAINLNKLTMKSCSRNHFFSLKKNGNTCYKRTFNDMEKYSRYIGRRKEQISKMQMQHESIVKDRMHSECVYVCVCAHMCMFEQENSRKIFTKVLAVNLFGCQVF